MDRRRFVPSTEGLEGRALLATSLFGSASLNSDPTLTVPMTYQVKEQRIERLPHYMELFRSGRFLPTDTIHQLQADLTDIATKLHPPGSAPLNGFNTRLRDVEPSNSLSPADAAGLSRSFGVVLKAMGATPGQVDDLQRDMNALVKVDASGPQPVFLATNDYTVVLQTILGVGRPIRRPTVPQLAAENGTRVNANVGVTPKSQPTLVGTYDAFTTMQIVDANLNVYGSAVVQRAGATQSNGQAVANGKYAVTFDKPLAPGIYTFHVRAVDAQGHESHLSPPFKLKVITRPVDRVAATSSVPGGPLGLK